MIRSRGVLPLAGGLVVLVVVLAVVAGLRGRAGLPVVAMLGGAPVELATVQLGWAVVVPPLLVAVVAALRAFGRLAQTAIPWALGAASPIVLFLVARLNGVVDAAALVLVYAVTAGAVLLRSLHRPGGDPLPLRWSAALGIVPWGVVAFTQIGGLLAGTPPSIAVRALTVVVLAASIGEYVVAYRRRDEPVLPRVGLALVAAPAVLLAVLALLV
ncbi:MAG: hypothetical protein HIU86_11090 [Acidobacteria bacterium]|nr:hypothetical protein [Acidobacteriota bacterium]